MIKFDVGSEFDIWVRVFMAAVAGLSATREDSDWVVQNAIAIATEAIPEIKKQMRNYPTERY